MEWSWPAQQSELEKSHPWHPNITDIHIITVAVSEEATF